MVCNLHHNAWLFSPFVILTLRLCFRKTMPHCRSQKRRRLYFRQWRYFRQWNMFLAVSEIYFRQSAKYIFGSQWIIFSAVKYVFSSEIHFRRSVKYIFGSQWKYFRQWNIFSAVNMFSAVEYVFGSEIYFRQWNIF